MSGKQSRRRRHDTAPTATPRKASPRVLLIGGIVLAFAAAALALGALTRTSPPKLTGVATATTLFDGIEQHGNVLGSPSAPVTLVEYADLQCPYCREFETQAMPTLIQRYVRAGKVRVEFRPLAFIGDDSVRGRNAILAAGKQNHLFDLTQLFYENQQVENTGWLDDGLVSRAAKAVPGLDLAQLHAAREGAAVAGSASSFDTMAQKAGVDSTPTLFVGPTGGKLQKLTLMTPNDGETPAAAIDALLR